MRAKLLQFLNFKTKRERILFFSVVGCALFVWASMLISGTSELANETLRTDGRLAVCNAAIARAPIIAAELARMEKQFNAANTLDALKLQMAVERAAKEAGFDFSISSATTKQAGKFKINSLSLTARKAMLKNCAQFEQNMRNLEPYAAISRATFEASDSGELSVKYEISSFEL